MKCVGWNNLIFLHLWLPIRSIIHAGVLNVLCTILHSIPFDDNEAFMHALDGIEMILKRALDSKSPELDLEQNPNSILVFEAICRVEFYFFQK